MKKPFRFVAVLLSVLLSAIVFSSCNNGSSTTTTTDSSTTTTTTDTAGSMSKMGDSTNTMKIMTDSPKQDTGGRNTQNIPPPKPKQ